MDEDGLKLKAIASEANGQIETDPSLGETMSCHSNKNNNDRLRKQQDEQLYKIIQEILNQDDGSGEPQQAFESLFKLIPKLSGIEENIDPRIDCQAALNQTFRIVQLKIKRFPKKYELDINNSDAEYVRMCFVKWFNKSLRPMIDKLYYEFGEQSMNLEVGFSGSRPDNSLKVNVLAQKAAQERLQKLKDYIEEDPDGMLQRHPDGAPQCSCQELCKRRLLSKPPKKWRNIAKDLHLPQKKIKDFWHEYCKPLLGEIDKKLGE